MVSSNPHEQEDGEMMETEEDRFPVDEDDLDDTPVFLGEGDAVEVEVDDANIPMDDDDDDDDDGEDVEVEDAAPIVDMAKHVITCHTDPVYALACSMAGPTLRLVSGGGDDKAWWHEINDGIHSTPLESHFSFKDSISAVASNAAFVAFDATKPPNPEWMAVGALDGSIVLFGGAGKVLPLEGPSADIEWLCWHPKGGNVLLVGSADATIWMYHTSLNKCLQVFVGHEDAVTCGAFSADGKVALSGSADGTLRIWAPKTGKSKHVFRFDHGGGPTSALTCIATHGGTDQQLVLVGGDDGQAHVCHVANKKHVASLRHFDPTQHQPPQSSAATEEEDEEEDVMMLPSGVEAVGFCQSNPNWCATGGMDGVLKIWDLANQGQCRTACHVNDGTITTVMGQQVTPTTPTKRGDGITQLTWHPTLPLVITSTCRGQVHLWDARNGGLLRTLTGHADVINDMDVSFVPSAAGGPAGRAIIATASDDQTVRIFHLDLDAALQPTQQLH